MRPKLIQGRARPVVGLLRVPHGAVVLQKLIELLQRCHRARGFVRKTIHAHGLFVANCFKKLWFQMLRSQGVFLQKLSVQDNRT